MRLISNLENPTTNESIDPFPHFLDTLNVCIYICLYICMYVYIHTSLYIYVLAIAVQTAEPNWLKFYE